MIKRLSGLLAEIELSIVSLWINLILTHSHWCLGCSMAETYRAQWELAVINVARILLCYVVQIRICLDQMNVMGTWMQILVKGYIGWFVLETVERRFSLVYLTIRGVLAGSMRWPHILGLFLAAPLADNPIRFVLCGFNVDTCPLLGRMSNLSGNFAASSSTIQYSASYKK